MCHWSFTAGEKRRKGKADCEQLFLKLLYCGDQPREFNNPIKQWRYKNTFGHLTNFHCVELFQICFLSFVRLKLQDQFSPVNMEKSVAFTSISLTPITQFNRCTDMSAFITHTHIHTHITCNHNQDFSSSCEIKGRAWVWHNIYFERLLNYKILILTAQSNKMCARLKLHWYGKGSCRSSS